jgi:hypothetical protein
MANLLACVPLKKRNLQHSFAVLRQATPVKLFHKERIRAIPRPRRDRLACSLGQEVRP